MKSTPVCPLLHHVLWCTRCHEGACASCTALSTIVAISVAPRPRNQEGARHSEYSRAAGICDGYSYEGIKEKWPQTYQARKADKVNFRYPAGESYMDVIKRLESVIIEVPSAPALLPPLLSSLFAAFWHRRCTCLATSTSVLPSSRGLLSRLSCGTLRVLSARVPVRVRCAAGRCVYYLVCFWPAVSHVCRWLEKQEEAR